MIGRIIFYNPERQYGALIGPDGIRYLVQDSDVGADIYGRVTLTGGELADFEPFQDSHGYLAKSVRSKREVQFDPDYREVARMKTWNQSRGFGFAISEFNKRGLYVHVSKIITLGKLKVGSMIRCLPVPGDIGKPFTATEIEIFIDPAEPVKIEPAPPVGVANELR